MNKRKYVPLLAFITLFLFVLLVGGTMPYFLFYILLLIYAVPFIHCLINFIFLQGTVEIPKGSLYTGDTIEVKYRVINNSIFPITYLEIENDFSKKLTGISSPKITLSIEKKGFYQGSETIVLRRRGFYQMGEITVTIKDAFGFFSIKKKISSTTSLLVFPEVIDLSTFKTSASQQTGELLIWDSSFQDKSGINTLREYQEGDSIKSIHWKLTARKNTPIVKEYENRGDTQVNIFVDNDYRLFKNDVDNRVEDKIVDVTTSVVSYCLNQNIEVTLETLSHNEHIKIQGRRKHDFKPFLEALAKFRGNGNMDFLSFISPKIETMNRGATVVIVTPNLDKAIGSLGINLRMKNLYPLFIVVTDNENETGHIDSLIEKRLKSEGIPVYWLDYKTNIREALEGYYG